MSRERDETIEDRIAMKIVVDCCSDEEQMMGWYYYLEDTLHFPFKAEVTAKRRISPLAVGQIVEAVGMGDVNDCHLDEMWVDIRWQEDVLSVPPAQLDPVDANKRTMRAVDEWHYWLAQGYG
jgi:hypothetical protein